MINNRPCAIGLILNYGLFQSPKPQKLTPFLTIVGKLAINIDFFSTIFYFQKKNYVRLIGVSINSSEHLIQIYDANIFFTKNLYSIE